RPLPDFRPGVASFFLGAWRPLRINWLVVGMRRRRLAGWIVLGPAQTSVGTASPSYSHAVRGPEVPSRRSGARGAKLPAVPWRSGHDWSADASLEDPEGNPSLTHREGNRRAAEPHSRPVRM